MRKIITFKFLLLVTVLAVRAQSSIEVFDAYSEAARRSFEIPGMSIVIVQDGKVLLSKGYGIRELGRNEQVTSQTLFGAMSTTKAMTAVAMAILFEEGKIDPREKVIRYLPDFRIGDPYITQELEVRDLFTHTSGLASTDFLWARTPELAPDEAVRRMQYARPAYSLRSGFVYHNSMYLVAGKVIEKAAGVPWEQFMTERVFRPLGMTSTLPTLAEAIKQPDRSRPHYKIKGKIEVISEMPIDSVAPAGSVWSNADDMAKWIAFLVTGRSNEGKQLLKPETLNELFKPQVILPSTFYPTFRLTKPNFTTYAYGWFQHDYRGEKVDFHTGSIAGRTAIIGLIRNKKLGIYIFGNLDHAEARHALMYKAFDLFGFGDNGRDWSSEVKALYDTLDAEATKRSEAQLAKRLSGTRPSLPITAYAGTYSDPFYGVMEVKVVDGKLRLIAAKEMAADLEHRHVDTFIAVWDQRWRGESLITFQLDPMTGEVRNMLAGGQTFRRRPMP